MHVIFLLRVAVRDTLGSKKEQPEWMVFRSKDRLYNIYGYSV